MVILLHRHFQIEIAITGQGVKSPCPVSFVITLALQHKALHHV